MAVHHEENHYSCDINPIRVRAPDQLHRPSRKVCVEFVYKVLHSYENKSLDNQRTLINRYQDPGETKKVQRQYERSMLALQSRGKMFGIISDVLGIFGIPNDNESYETHDEIAAEILYRITNSASAQVDGFSVCITRKHTKIHCERHCGIQCERCLMGGLMFERRLRELLMERALRERALLQRQVRLLERLREMSLLQRALRESEAERMRNMFVPASESAIKNLLKRVRVEEENGDDREESTRKRRKSAGSGSSGEVGDSGYCTVCLEPVESNATEMPCKHAFHEDCIVGWLKVSHYCPVCKAEVPTN